MDDRTKGVGDESMAGIGDEETVGRSETGTSRRRTSAAADRMRGRGETRVRAAAGVAEREDTDQRTEQIKAEIERTRDDMSETIDAIQDRINPRNVAANAVESVRQAASSTAASVKSAASEAIDEVSESRVVQQVRSNPVPAVMVGVGLVGLAWLAFGDRGGRRRRGRTEVYDHGSSFGYYEQPEDDYRGSGAGTRAGATASNLASTTGEYAREASEKARETTRRAQSQLQRAINENPLAVGAAALAVGAIIGMALPETERENELMGEARDNVVERGQEMARTAANRVQEAATDAAKKVQDVATDVSGLLNTEK